jgi:hypothetical protein
MPDMTYIPIRDVDAYAADYDPDNEGERAELLALLLLYSRTRGLPTAVWDNDTQTLRYANSGRAVPEKVVRRAMNAVSLGVAQEQLGPMARQLQSGEVSLQDWHDTGARDLRVLYWLGASLAFGGLGRALMPGEKALVTPIIAGQLRFWERLASDLATAAPVKRARAYARAIMYGRAGSAVYQNTRRVFHRRVLRYSEERRILGVVEKHCEDCPGYAQRGWQPIGTLPAIGDSACRSNCACYFEFRNPVEAQA